MYFGWDRLWRPLSLQSVLRCLTAAAILQSNYSQAADPKAAPQPIKVPQTLALGEVTKGTVLTRQFPIVNGNDSAAERLTVDSSCDCTKILSAPGSLNPHQIAMVTLQYAPNKIGEAKIELLVSAKFNAKTVTSQISASALVKEQDQNSVGTVGTLLSSVTAEGAIKEPTAVLVDIRSAADFQNVRIPGSLNIPLFALKVQEFLKARPIVLVNEGAITQSLQWETVQLAKAGFISVRFLQGGIRAWQCAGGKLEGRAPMDASYLGLDQLGEVEQSPDWKTIFVTSEAEVAKAAKILKARSNGSTLIIASDRSLTQKLQTSLVKVSSPVLFLNGTVEDWFRFHSNLISSSPVSSVVIGSAPAHTLSIRSGKGSPCKSCGH